MSNGLLRIRVHIKLFALVINCTEHENAKIQTFAVVYSGNLFRHLEIDLILEARTLLLLLPLSALKLFVIYRRTITLWLLRAICIELEIGDTLLITHGRRSIEKRSSCHVVKFTPVAVRGRRQSQIESQWLSIASNICDH